MRAAPQTGDRSFPLPVTTGPDGVRTPSASSGPRSSSWCTALHDLGVITVAEAFSVRPMAPGRTRRGLTPCPACDAATRTTEHHIDERRGPVGLTGDGMGWRCHVCGAHGDAVTLASLCVGEGGRSTPAVAAACEAKGLIGHSARPRPRLVTQPPGYPDPDEIVALLRSCVGVQQDTEAELWLNRRGLDVGVVKALESVRVLPAASRDLPRWASRGGDPWTATGHRLIVPLYDADGLLRSVRARDITGEAEVKELTPAGFDVGGLVLACPTARALLRGTWLVATGERAADHVCERGLVIAEGVPDWLTWLCWYPNRSAGPAVVGIGSGAWRRDHAARVPDGTTVTIATHDDKAGDDYAMRVSGTFDGRDVRLRRWRPT